ncbi:glycosyltransferase family 4 protein [Winogradskyella litoriviva]|uniref:Glycosyltransferase family 4 protein n=1 Tax=Winogradskyella litoriviva TaxID=1220182 RepID=A0ABX2E2U1_9FLAO|nr:glycosyltransferase family 4 protein [Winogradskyella litoriviva]NRD22814.1 glycosyltransferase family 4 protein [Winogradskyella litoriviva]
MKKNVLYIGNALSNKGKTSSTIDTLSAHLKAMSNLKIASTKSNKVLRLLDMAVLVIRNSYNTDFVLIDTYSTVNFYYALVISQMCRLFNIKYIPILHGGNLEHRLVNNPKLSQRIFKNAYQLIAPSNFLKSVFNNYGYKDVQYIPNSIELENYTFKNRNIDVIRLLWVRSFSSIYNPELAVLVLEKLLKLNYKAELTMIGPDVDGSLTKVKALTAQKNLNVTFTGKLSKQQWINYSTDANIFINTTNFDNTPVSVIEAMALGLPIVSTNVGGLPFLISDNFDGVLVNANDCNAMVEAIIRIKDNAEFKHKLVENARKKVENFSWQSVKPKWQNLLS